MAKGLLDSGKGKAISLDDLKEGMSAEELANQTPEEPTVQSVEEPKVEEPVVEKPTEEPKVEVKSQEPKEEPVEEPKPEVKTEESTSNQFDFALFNKTLNTNYESLDQIKADLTKPTMESEYTEVKQKLDEWQAKFNDLNKDYDLLTEQLDPSVYFSSDEAMKLEAFKKANPDKDASIAQKVFATEDLASIDNIDMVKMGWKFNTPNLKGTDKDLEQAIAEELNQDPDIPVSEWPVSAQNRLARMAADYANQFKQIRSSVTLPEKVDIESLKAQRKQAEEQLQAELTEGWGKVADETLTSTNSIKVPIGKPEEGAEQQFFVWELGEVPKSEVETLKERFISMGLDPKEDKAAFQETLNLALFQKNVSQIMQKYGEDLLAQSEEKHLEETNNPNPLKDTERKDLTQEDKDKQEQTEFAKNVGPPRFKYNPLFSKQT